MSRRTHEIDDLVSANETKQQRLHVKTEIDLCEFGNERILNGVARTFFHAAFEWDKTHPNVLTLPIKSMLNCRAAYSSVRIACVPSIRIFNISTRISMRMKKPYKESAFYFNVPHARARPICYDDYVFRFLLCFSSFFFVETHFQFAKKKKK